MTEREIFVFEGLRADIQYDLLRAMKQGGVSKSELARKMDVSPAWVSQITDDDANLTLETLAKLYVALGRVPQFSSQPSGDKP